MSDGGKGDKPRPIADKKQYDENYDRIFAKSKGKTTDYQDILSTEDCVLEALDNLKKE